MDRDPAHPYTEVTASPSPSALLQDLVQRQRPRLVAHLTRHLGLGHLALAEDAVQHACLQALRHWPTQGSPDNPAGWLWRASLNHATDSLRHGQRLRPLPADDAGHPATADTIASAGIVINDMATAAWTDAVPIEVNPPSTRFAGEVDDDELALLFAACHPALPTGSQVALALRAITGLDLATLAAMPCCAPKPRWRSAWPAPARA